MICPECDTKFICIETTPGPVSCGKMWYAEGEGWHVHFPVGFTSTQVFECKNGHQYLEKWTPTCQTCFPKLR